EEKVERGKKTSSTRKRTFSARQRKSPCICQAIWGAKGSCLASMKDDHASMRYVGRLWEAVLSSKELSYVQKSATCDQKAVIRPRGDLYVYDEHFRHPKDKLCIPE
ncbi:unnamed protein product, partial [Citrullus colocynthis]